MVKPRGRGGGLISRGADNYKRVARSRRREVPAVDEGDGEGIEDGLGLSSKHGEAVFTQCKTCHVIDAGVNRIGPSLHGIIGRKSGQIAGFSYSTANKESGITWTPAKLYQYLEKPARVVPGTKMAFAGLAKGQDRADVIAYLTEATK